MKRSYTGYIMKHHSKSAYEVNLAVSCSNSAYMDLDVGCVSTHHQKKAVRINHSLIHPWLNWNVPGKLDQYHGSWCPGSLHHQDISSIGIEFMRSTISCLLRGRTSMRCVARISTFCAISVLRNDRNVWEEPPYICITVSYNTVSGIDALVQDYSNSIASALELLQSCTKPSI